MPEEKPEGLGGMDALANLAKHFIIRDVIYAIGGGVLILSATYACGSLSTELQALATAPTIASLLLIGISWAVGYGVSDGLGGIVPALLNGSLRSGAKPYNLQSPSWWPFVRTDYIHKAQDWPKRLFESFAQEEWKPPSRDEVSVDDFRETAADLIDQEFGSYHRTVLLRHLGSAIGACGLLSSLTTIFGMWMKVGWTALGVVFSLGGVFVSVLLLMIGWVKALQQTQAINNAVLKRKQEAEA